MFTGSPRLCENDEGAIASAEHASAVLEETARLQTEGQMSYSNSGCVVLGYIGEDEG